MSMIRFLGTGISKATLNLSTNLTDSMYKVSITRNFSSSIPQNLSTGSTDSRHKDNIAIWRTLVLRFKHPTLK